MVERIWHLKNCSLFERLDDDQLRSLEAKSRSRNFPPHATVYLPDQQSDQVFLLVKGLVKVAI